MVVLAGTYYERYTNPPVSIHTYVGGLRNAGFEIHRPSVGVAFGRRDSSDGGVTGPDATSEDTVFAGLNGLNGVCSRPALVCW